MKKINVSAPGKLMLFGEHAVVYNHPCIVTAVDQRMRATVEVLSSKEFHLEAPDVKVTGYKKGLDLIGKGEIPKGAQFIEIALKNFIEKYPINSGLKVTTSSDFSTFGFGGSSASTVCTVYALSKLLDLNLSNKEIFDISYKTILDVQKKGSGFDVAAAVYGGTLYYVTGRKVIKSLNIKSLPLVVGYSGVKADTVTLMDQVGKLAAKYPKVVDGIYSNIEILVEAAKKSLISKDFISVGELMNINQGYLESLGVNTDKLSSMIFAARRAGAYGAKLSGAGGGDCMIAVVGSNFSKKTKTAIEKAGGEVINVKPNAEGVRTE